jgi:DNA-binding NtrC family response regulator
MKIQSQRRSPATRSVATRKRHFRKPFKPAVLIVDDDYCMREMASMILKRFAGVRTLRAATNAQALKKALRHKMAAVVSDLVRSGGSGFEFLKQFKKAHPRIPVIICSGNSQPSDRRRAKRLGAFAFFPKPYMGEDLASVVIDALRSASGNNPLC